MSLLKSLVAASLAARPVAARNTVTATVTVAPLTAMDAAMALVAAEVEAVAGLAFPADEPWAVAPVGALARGLDLTLGRRVIWQAAIFSPLGFRDVQGLDALSLDGTPVATVAAYRTGMTPIRGWVNLTTGEWYTPSQAARNLCLS